MGRLDTPSSSAHTAQTLRHVLRADAALELAVGVCLIAGARRASRWFDLPEEAALAAGIVFAATAVIIFALSRAVLNEQRLRGLAFANIGGGVLAWVAATFFWGRFEPEGRWILALVADSTILVGLAEWLAARRHFGQPR
jgi:drug/metabolite transporter (DMT)-like permease